MVPPCRPSGLWGEGCLVSLSAPKDAQVTVRNAICKVSIPKRGEGHSSMKHRGPRPWDKTSQMPPKRSGQQAGALPPARGGAGCGGRRALLQSPQLLAIPVSITTPRAAQAQGSTLGGGGAGPRLRPERTKTGRARDSFVQFLPCPPLKYSQVTKLPLDKKPRMKAPIN